MGGIVKSIVSPIIGKRGEKKAFQAETRGIGRAISEQEGVYGDIKSSNEALRDQNIESLEGLAGRTQGSYDTNFAELERLLEEQAGGVLQQQQGLFDSQENRLLKNFDDIIAKSQASFDYAKQNYMPYIEQGQQAFNTYVSKVNEGFDIDPFQASQNNFQYDDFNFDYEQSPGYQFIKDQALKSATNTQAAQGMGLSGATQKALQDRAAGLAAQDYGNQFNRAMLAYQSDRDRDFREYQNQYNQERQAYEFGLNAELANRQNQLAQLSGIANTGLGFQQDVVNRQKGMAEFEINAKNELRDALLANDAGRAQAIINNIITLTGGKGELASQATAIKTQIDSGLTSGIIGQNTTASQNINDIRSQTGTNIANLEMGKGQAEANYQRNRSALQTQLAGGLIDGGIAAASAIAGGAGGFGGPGGLQGAMQGLNFGSELSTMGAGSTFSPQAMNYAQTGMYQAPQPTMPQPSGMGLGWLRPQQYTLGG